jgi:hypothetical protein
VIGGGTVVTKRYAEPVEVEAPEGSIEAFWWRGKRYQVREIICRWRERGEWWTAAGQAAKPWQADGELEVVRLDAVPTTNGLAPGTYELTCTLSTGAWHLFRVYD